MKHFFTSASNYSTLLISLIISVLMTACSQQIDTIKPAAETAAARVDNSVSDSTSTLKSVASFPIGVSLDTKLMSNPKIQAIVANQFSSRTVPLFMNIEPVRGQFNYAVMDARMNATDGQAMRLHGHCLVYHVAAPDWLINFSGGTNDFEKAVKNHIQTIVGRYKGKVKSWDVINEIFDYKGELKKTAFRNLYESDAAYMTFVKHCFQWANEADPSAKLIYNDFDYETYPAKLNAALRMVDDFKKAGIPIHGLGTQMHINVNTPEAAIQNSLQQLAATGLLVHMSELDIAVNPKKDPNFNFTNDVQLAQKVKYQNVATLYKLNVPVKQQHGITAWSVSDADSWLVTDMKLREMPTMFDAQQDKKPAYYGMLNGLK